MEIPTSRERLDRRTVLKGLGVSVAGFGATGTATAQGQGGSELVRIGANTFDNDGGGPDVAVERARFGGRPRVAHVTSGGTQTTDYVTTVVNVGRVPLGDVSSLTYDYYATPGNQEAPDEVFFLLEDADGDAHTVWHHEDGGAVGAWQTRTVHEEITSSGSFQWRELGEGYIGRNLIDAFSDAAAIRRVGAGHGTTASPGAVSDIYFDDLRVNGAGRGQFPTR